MNNNSGFDGLNESNDITNKKTKVKNNNQNQVDISQNQNGNNRKRKKNEPGCECMIF